MNTMMSTTSFTLTNASKALRRLVGGAVVAVGSTALGAPITSYTLTGSTDTDGQYNAADATVASITTVEGGTVFSLIGPTSVTQIDGPGARFRGDAETGEFSTEAPAFLIGNVPTRAWGDSGFNSADVYFGQTISDSAAGVDTAFELFLLELGGGDSFSIAAITGTQETPSVGPFVSFGTSVLTGVPEVDLVSSTGGNFTGVLGGVAIDISDLGVSDLIGIRFETTGGDPAVILAVPEPASLALLGLGSAVMLLRRRHTSGGR